MRRVTIAVIGNGKTSRANVEALLNDTIESFDETYIALIYDKTPSEGVVWAKDKVARIRATSTKADASRDANDAAILEAQEKEAERQRQQGCRKLLLSSLQRVGSTGSNSEAEEMRDEDDE